MDYETKAFRVGQPSHQVVSISFELAYPDWCKLKDTETWHRLEEAVEAFQKEPAQKQTQDYQFE